MWPKRGGQSATTAESVPDLEEQLTTLRQRFPDAVWKADSPVAALTDLLADLDGNPLLATPTGAMVNAQAVAALRDRDRLPAALTLLDPHAGNPWVDLSRVDLLRIAGRTEEAFTIVTTHLPNLSAMDHTLQVHWLFAASRVNATCADAAARVLSGSAIADEWPLEFAMGEQISEERVAYFARQLHALDSRYYPFTDDEALTVIRLLVALQQDPSPIRRQTVPWHEVDAIDAAYVESVVDGVLAAVTSRTGYSLVRLGDGEGVVMRGQRANLGGAVGRGPDGHLRELDDYEHEQFLADLTASLLTADLVGIPDLVQCLHGPVDTRTVPLSVLDAGIDRERIVSGGWYLHLALEATGEIKRLLPHLTGVIGPVNPRDMRPIADRTDVEWLAVPGEIFYYDYDNASASHWDDCYRDIMACPFEPGQLWLVGAGTLGKMYCGAIRAAGGVAIDIGALFDLWSGRADTRGEVRQNPWITLPYRD